MAAASSTAPTGPTRQRVIIIGGGFAGLYTALALASEPEPPSVLLIEPREQFVFLPLLYELLSGELPAWQVAPRYDDILAGHGIPRLAERVERIDTAAGWVQTGSGQRLSYDRLVIACGGGSDHFGIPGADHHSLGFRSLGDVERLQALLTGLRQRSRPLQRLAVVGAGPTGVELACKLADLCAGDAVIELIEQGEAPLPASSAFNREQADLALRRRDVRLRCRTRVTAVRADALELSHRDAPADAADAPGQASGELLPVNGVLWTAGLRFRPPLISPTPAQDRQGRLLCDAELRLQGQPRVFVAGDLARLPPSESASGDDAPQAPLPASAQVAFQQASLLARNLRHSLADEPLEPFHWRNLGEMLSLGRGEASLTASGLTLAGPAAFQLRRLAYLTRLPGLGQQLRAAAAWAAEALP